MSIRLHPIIVSNWLQQRLTTHTGCKIPRPQPQDGQTRLHGPQPEPALLGPPRGIRHRRARRISPEQPLRPEVAADRRLRRLHRRRLPATLCPEPRGVRGRALLEQRRHGRCERHGAAVSLPRSCRPRCEGGASPRSISCPSAPAWSGRSWCTARTGSRASCRT